MTDANSRASIVEVAVDPDTAFTAFTAELDRWWVRGPINAYDSSRLVEMRCEPGVGGRIREVYDAATGDGLEIARITDWEPGRRIAWQSSLDDVRIDVRFEPTRGGTIVRLEATIPAGGADRGGTSFIRVTPAWFGAWIRRRQEGAEAPHLGRLGLSIRYTRPRATARWLAASFGFESPSPLPEGDDTPSDEDDTPWIEFQVGGCSIIIEALRGAKVEPADVHIPWVYVDDLEAHLERARDGGATIVEGISRYGYTSYVAEDVEGRRWRFLQASPTQR